MPREIAEYDRVGEETFFAKYGFKAADVAKLPPNEPYEGEEGGFTMRLHNR